MRILGVLVAVVASFAAQNVDAFSPASRSRVLNDLREMKMTGAGGAAQPDNYVEGESSVMYVLSNIRSEEYVELEILLCNKGSGL